MVPHSRQSSDCLSLWPLSHDTMLACHLHNIAALLSEAVECCPSFACISLAGVWLLIPLERMEAEKFRCSFMHYESLSELANQVVYIDASIAYGLGGHGVGRSSTCYLFTGLMGRAALYVIIGFAWVMSLTFKLSVPGA